MPGGWSSTKNSGKPVRQLHFSEALLHSKVPRPTPVAQPPARHHTMADSSQESTMDRILQEISAVGHRLEGMDSAMVSLTAETKSIRLDIAGFHSRVMGLEQQVTTVEAHVGSSRDRDQELLFLRSKMTDLEDRSRRDTVRFLGFPENIEDEDIHTFLRETLPKLTGITFDPPLEFQRAHRLGPRRPDAATCPRPIIACLFCHAPAHQLIQRARTHGTRQMDGQEICRTADFSKETSERRRALLALRPRLRQMEVKYNLFEPARMWIMKNGVSKDFYAPEDLRSFLDDLLPMDTSILIPPRAPTVADQNALPQGLTPRGSGLTATLLSPISGDETWRDS
ncbi:hypothetical protein NDU88_004097 [Pleurodeles waltl]|uniref:Uncharacterized protein n=1 Tax=Pleurodeles waltl TaxID=8319 RepID=A0AAV7TQB0_PLEWA|nr:hypothetical protein NDU88_004097 [Pleurodeles waltl]